MKIDLFTLNLFISHVSVFICRGMKLYRYSEKVSVCIGRWSSMYGSSQGRLYKAICPETICQMSRLQSHFFDRQSERRLSSQTIPWWLCFAQITARQPMICWSCCCKTWTTSREANPKDFEDRGRGEGERPRGRGREGGEEREIERQRYRET